MKTRSPRRRAKASAVNETEFAKSAPVRRLPKRTLPPPKFRPAVEIIAPVPPTGFERSAPVSVSPRAQIRLNHHEPHAQEVFVAGSFNDWNPRTHPMIRDLSGNWSVELELPPGEHRYRLIIDGQWSDHSNARHFVQNPYGEMDAVLTIEPH